MGRRFIKASVANYTYALPGSGVLGVFDGHVELSNDDYTTGAFTLTLKRPPVFDVHFLLES